MFTSGQKRNRDEKYTRENGVKQISSGKIIYHCRFCKFIACTEGNIESHVKAKHPENNENMNIDPK
jgi:hypothetical protein